MAQNSDSRSTDMTNMDAIKRIQRSPDLEIVKYTTDFGMAKLPY